jgi:phosphohistidine phosphatase
MALYIVQHGKSLPKEKDPEKGLSPEGRGETERIAKVAGGYNVKVSKIIHSGKKRARETAEAIAAVLSPENGLEARSGMKPLDGVEAFEKTLNLDQNLMLVGHLPFLERLVSLLVCGNPDRTVFKLQNSGILSLDHVPDVDHPVIRWGLMPNVG